ncbi:MAG: T9SS type A sorting domain-containing protein [Bacteroidales bacterium]|nr:T9SS type A sorting domain-containing protein [Bacteroidales bacterium]
MKKLCTFLFLLTLSTLSIYSQEFKEFSRFEKTSTHNFGATVVMSKNYAATNTIFKTSNEDFTNSIYIYKQNNDNTWSEIDVISKSDSLGFGKSIEISENFLFVGSFTDSTSGEILIYQRNNSTYEYLTTLKPNNSGIGNLFGYSISYDETNSKLAVSAPKFNSRGAVYIFTKKDDNWTQTNILQENVTNVNCLWGFDIKLINNQLLVGAPDEKYVDDSNGRAYFYELNNTTWQLKKELLPDEHQNYQKFGYSVDFNSTNIIVSAPGFNNNSGRVYIYNNDGEYVQTQSIGNPSSNSGDYFGHSISVDGNYLTIGSINELITETGSQSGACFIYQNSTSWIKIQKIYPQINHTNGLYFGYSTFMRDSSVIIGMPGNSLQKIYIYDLPKPFITLHPINNDSIESTTIAHFSIKADDAQNYIWQASRDNGLTFTDLDKNSTFLDVISDTLSIYTDNILNNYLFRCKASNQYGYSISNSAKLTIAYNSQISKIYPNPNTGAFTLELFCEFTGWTATIYDARKQIIFEQQLNSNQTFIDLGKLSPGVYILSLVNGNQKEYQKIIIKQF